MADVSPSITIGPVWAWLVRTTTMTLWEHLMIRIQWTQLDPDEWAADTPRFIHGLVHASTDQEADSARSWLEEAISTTWDHYYATGPAIAEVALAALAEIKDSIVQRRLLRLLVHTYGSNPHLPTAEPVYRVIASGHWLFYGLLNNEDPEVQRDALSLAVWADPDRARAESMLDYLANDGSGKALREAALIIRQQGWWRTRAGTY